MPRKASGHLSGLTILTLVSLMSVLLAPAAAQDYLTRIGSPTFTTAQPVEMGFVNLGNGNVHLEIPVTASPQRGKRGFSARLVYDSRIWKVVGTAWQPTNVANSQGGWRFITSGDTGAVNYTVKTLKCGFVGSQSIYTMYTGYNWTAPDGTQHDFQIMTISDPTANCFGGSIPSGDAFASDSTGYHMYVTQFTRATVFAADGTQVFPTVKDPNGNYFSTDANGNVVDTLGRTRVTKTVNGNLTYYDVLNSQNSNSRFTVTTITANVNTNFGQTGVTEYSGTLTVIQSISLPDGTSYTFAYDSGTTPGNFGLIKSLTLPTGGTVNYTHTSFSDSYGNTNRWVNTRVAGGGTWTYTPAVITTCAQGGTGCQEKVTLTKPNGDQAVYLSTLDNGAWHAEIDSYTGSAGSGTLLSTLLTDYDFSQPGGIYIVPIRNTLTLPIPGASISKKTEYSYDTYLNATEIREWNFYAGTPSTSPNRKTDITYVTSTSYLNANIINLPTTVTVSSGTGTWTAQTNVTYDSTALTSVTGIIHHDDAGFGTGNTVRGNPTVIQRFAASAASCLSPNCLSTTLTYDTTGQVLQVSDPLGNATTLSYLDSFFNDNGSNPPQAYTPPTPTNAYLTTITPPLIGAGTASYYFNTGWQASATDQNGAASYFHYLDSLDRLTHRYLPGGVWGLTQYSSSTQVDTYSSVTDTSPSVSCTSCVHQRRTLDGLGRVLEGSLVNDPQGATLVDTAYDSSGRTQSVSHPYRSTSDPTYGLETPSYDGLNRTTSITHQDGKSVQTFYGAAVTGGGGASSQLCASATYGLGYPVLSVDEAGKKRQSWTDGLGRVIEADEPDSNNSLTVNTCYKYDLLNDLTEVDQGTQTRTYTYDGLSRLMASAAPEAGSTSVYYTTSTGTLCSGNPSNTCRRLDARSVTTTYSYDALNRLASVTYSDSTPAVTFSYDQTTFNGLTITNGKGRRTGMTDGSGQTAWSYDAAGRVLTERRTISGVTKTVSYSYNLDGSLASLTYPSGRTITYGVSAIGRPVSAKDLTNNINYVTGAQYAPQGALSGLTNGSTGTFAGITTANSYNNRLQAALLSTAAPSQTVLNLSYGYGTTNNGQIATIVNNINNNRTQNFTYDTLRRLYTAQSQATSGADCWGQSFGYDRWGNLLTATVSQCSAPALNVTVNSATNRITSTGFTYDAAGAMTNEGGSTAYTWNDANQITSAAGVTYTYDANGLRVKKSSGKLYWRGMGVNTLAETDLSGNTTAELIYFAGNLVALRDASTGSDYYHFVDQLGSTRVITDASGTVCYDADFFPFGGENVKVGTCPQAYKFTGYERDPETGLDYAMMRYYNSRLGRFMSPDPLGGSIPDPQSMNRYPYVLNDPVNATDPLGLHDRPVYYVAPAPPVGTAIWGNTIFDALFGAPGTFIYIDSGSNLYFGFSIELWQAEYALLEELEGGKDPGAGINALFAWPHTPDTPLEKCRSDAIQAYNNTWQITGVTEAAEKSAPHGGWEVLAHVVGGAAGAIMSGVGAIEALAGPLKQSIKEFRDLGNRLAACNATYGPKQ